MIWLGVAGAWAACVALFFRLCRKAPLMDERTGSVVTRQSSPATPVTIVLTDASPEAERAERSSESVGLVA